MNAARRKILALGIERLAEAQQLLTEAGDSFETVRDEEQEYFDNMPESIQSGEKGQAAEELISRLEEAIELITSVTEISTDDLEG